MLRPCPGVRPAAAQETLRHAAATADFLSQVASIGKITIKGLTVNGKLAQTPFFVDSNFSAASMGTATILNADLTTTDGLWVLSTVTPKPVKSVSYKDAAGKWTYTGGVDSHGFVHLINVV